MQIVVPDLNLTYRFGEHQICVCPVETLRKIGEITEKNQEDSKFQYLADFSVYLRSHSSVCDGTPIPLAVADFIWDHVQEEYVRQKKARQDGSLNTSQPTE